MKFHKLKGDVFMSLPCDSTRVHCQECIYGISEITSERVLPGWFQNPSIFRDGNKMTIIILFMSHHQRRRLQTDVRPIISFCDHWKHQKTKGFFILLGGIEKKWVDINKLTQSCHHKETSQLICRANQLTGFYKMAIWWV